MSLSTETDPVQTIKLILDNATSWTQPTPDRIERSETSEPSEKLRNSRLADVSIYVKSPDVGDLEKFDASGSRVLQTEIVQADIWTNDAATTNDYASDVISIIADYATDNVDQTQWVDIWPVTSIDNTAQAFHRQGFAIISVQARLIRNATA